MNKLLIIGNWKCNPITLQEAKKLFNLVKRGIRNIENVETVICPPFPYLSIVNCQMSNVKLGAQDCFWEEKGAFTGEASPSMLKNLGCQYVILGHSERRRYFNETDEMINKKIKTALIAKLKPIFCIGETQKQRDKGESSNILKSQLEKGILGISKKGMKNVTIAYEPVWAIGTGKPCDINTAQTMGLLIRKIITRIFGYSISKKLPILYGGSLNSKNAASYIFEANFQGLLVGGASLNPQEFSKIVKEVSRD